MFEMLNPVNAMAMAGRQVQHERKEGVNMKWPIYLFMLPLMVLGCADPKEEPIEGVDKDHPSYQFYLTARAAHVSEKACKNIGGSTLIEPLEIEKQENYEIVETFAPGYHRMRSKETGKTYLTASFLQQVVFAAIPKACSWLEE